MWISLTCLSALFLGVYDLAKKHAVDDNAVLPTLFFTTLSGALLLLPVLLLSRFMPQAAQAWHVYLPPQDLATHLLILCKSVIVGLSWIFSYFALKHLPVSVASPLRATGPLFTVMGAILFFGEKPTRGQAIGIALILAAYFWYSTQSLRTGRTFWSGQALRPGKGVAGTSGGSLGVAGSGHSGFWVTCMLLAALTGAVSGGYDKYLVQTRHVPNLFVVGFFLPYLALMFAVIAAITWWPRRASMPFRFKPSLVLVGWLLVAADLAYFQALSQPFAKLAVVSAIRRSNVMISFAGGMLLFKEGKNNAWKRRLVPFIGIALGLGFLLFSPRD